MPAIHLSKNEAQKMGITLGEFNKTPKKPLIKAKTHKAKQKHSAKLFSFAKYKGNNLLKRLI